MHSVANRNSHDAGSDAGAEGAEHSQSHGMGIGEPS